MVRVGQAPVLKIDRGDGVFLDTPSWSPADYPWSVIGGDFNGDGWLDFAFGPDGASPVRMQFGQSAIVPDCASEAGASTLQACTAVSLLDVIHGPAVGAVQHSQPRTGGH
jgi:hypothetical protein